MHHWRRAHFAEIAIPEGFSPLGEYLMEAHLGELQDAPDVQVDLAICVQLSLMDRPDHVIDAIDRPTSGDGSQPSLLGIVAAGEERVRDGSLDHPRVAGVRLMLGASTPDVVDRQMNPAGSRWRSLRGALARSGKHFTTMCTNKESAVRLLGIIPPEIPIGFDHLALGHAETDAREPGFRDLLRAARERGNVYFKGPGYRTSMDPQAVAPMIAAIVRECGPHSVLLGATDAPHVWLDPERGSPLRERFPHQTRVVDYLRRLADLVVAQVDIAGVTAEGLLSGNAMLAYERVMRQSTMA